MKVALIQMTSGSDVAANLAYLEGQVRAAVSSGAVFILTPENSDFMTETADQKRDQAFDEEHHPALLLFSSLAKRIRRVAFAWLNCNQAERWAIE